MVAEKGEEVISRRSENPEFEEKGGAADKRFGSCIVERAGDGLGEL